MISVWTYHCLVTVTFRATFISLSGTDAQTNASSRRYYIDTGKGKTTRYCLALPYLQFTGKGNMTLLCHVSTLREKGIWHVAVSLCYDPDYWKQEYDQSCLQMTGKRNMTHCCVVLSCLQINVILSRPQTMGKRNMTRCCLHLSCLHSIRFWLPSRKVRSIFVLSVLWSGRGSLYYVSTATWVEYRPVEIWRKVIRWLI